MKIPGVSPSYPRLGRKRPRAVCACQPPQARSWRLGIATSGSRDIAQYPAALLLRASAVVAERKKPPAAGFTRTKGRPQGTPSPRARIEPGAANRPPDTGTLTRAVPAKQVGRRALCLAVGTGLPGARGARSPVTEVVTPQIVFTRHSHEPRLEAVDEHALHRRRDSRWRISAGLGPPVRGTSGSSGSRSKAATAW